MIVACRRRSVQQDPFPDLSDGTSVKQEELDILNEDRCLYEYADYLEYTTSPLGDSVAARPVRGKIVWNSVSGPSFFHTSDLTFSPNGKHIAYVGEWHEGDVNQYCVVVDASRGEPLDGAWNPRWSPRGDRIAYMAKKGEDRFVVINDRIGSPYEDLGLILFSPDGERIAYSAKSNGRWGVVIDGKGRFEWDEEPEIAFAKDGTLGYVARKGATWCIVIGTKTVELGSVSKAGWLAVGIGGAHWAVAVRDENKKSRVLQDGKEGKKYDNAGDVMLDENGKALYLAWDSKGQFVVHDEKEDEGRYSYVSELALSPNGHSYAYLALDGERSRLVRDGIERKSGGDVRAALFGPRTGKLAYAIATEKDGWELWVDDKLVAVKCSLIREFRFSRDENRIGYCTEVKSAGKTQIWWKVVDLK